jgi:hypothetical protein
MNRVMGSRPGFAAGAALPSSFVKGLLPFVLLVACSGQAPPPPKSLPYVAVELPPSVRAYQSHEHNVRHPVIQVRFEMDPDDVRLLEERLPCRLGAVETGKPKYAYVERNEQPWYQPELVTRYRGCDFTTGRGIEASSFLVDVGVPGRVVVYAAIAYNWTPHR